MTHPSAPPPSGHNPWGAPPQQNVGDGQGGPPQQQGWPQQGQPPGQPQQPGQPPSAWGPPGQQQAWPQQGPPQQQAWPQQGPPQQGPPQQGWAPPGPPPQGHPQPGYGQYPPMPQPQQSMVYPNNPNPGIAAVASFFFPGVGQIILGQTVKGAVLLGVSLFTGYMCGLMSIVGAIDAWQIGKKLESGRPVGEWEFF